MNCAIPCFANTIVIAAVSVVFPWSTCPIVPTFTCGFVRSYFCFAILSGSCAHAAAPAPAVGSKRDDSLQVLQRAAPRFPVAAVTTDYWLPEGTPSLGEIRFAKVTGRTHEPQNLLPDGLECQPENQSK